MLYDLGQRLAALLRLHRDIRRLRQLDDRLLADVGLVRKDISASVRGRR